MRILILHNHYQQPGGEDQVFSAESMLLEKCGHEIIRYTKDNDEIKDLGSIRLVRNTFWNSQVYQELRHLIKTTRPQVVHFHNMFPLISPSAYYAAKHEDVPVVQTLHNYRLLCTNALLFRDGRVCEDCVTKFIPWPGVVHSCYRNSFIASGIVASLLAAQRSFKTWFEAVDVFIALTQFAKGKFIKGGLPSEKIAVKQNFLHPDPGFSGSTGEFVLFIGRLSMEKGILTLLKAWTKLRNIPLTVVGDGPLMKETINIVAKNQFKNVKVLGQQSHADVLTLLKEARFLVFPSGCYENFPMSIIESFACGIPVIASNLGAAREIIEDGRTGLLVTSGDPNDLADKVAWAWNRPEITEDMGKEARKEFEIKYTADQNLQKLINIYAGLAR